MIKALKTSSHWCGWRSWIEPSVSEKGILRSWIPESLSYCCCVLWINRNTKGLAGLTFLVLISIFRDQLRAQLQSYFGKLWMDPHSSSHGALSFLSLLFSCCFSHQISVLLVTHILWGKGQTTCISIDNRFQFSSIFSNSSPTRLCSPAVRTFWVLWVLIRSPLFSILFG